MGAAKEVLDKGVDAYNSRNRDAWTNLCAHDATINREPAGVAAWAWHYDRLCEAFPDSRFEVTSSAEEGDRVGYELAFRGTHTGILRTPFLETEATGKSVKVDCGGFIKVVDGKVRSLNVYGLDHLLVGAPRLWSIKRFAVPATLLFLLVLFAVPGLLLIPRPRLAVTSPPPFDLRITSTSATPAIIDRAELDVTSPSESSNIHLLNLRLWISSTDAPSQIQFIASLYSDAKAVNCHSSCEQEKNPVTNSQSTGTVVQDLITRSYSARDWALNRTSSVAYDWRSSATVKVSTDRFAFVENGEALEAILPAVYIDSPLTLRNQSTFDIKYAVADADGYAWTAGLQPQASASIVKWSEIPHAGTDPVTTAYTDPGQVSATNYNAQAQDQSRQFLAGILLGLAGAVAIEFVKGVPNKLLLVGGLGGYLTRALGRRHRV